MGSLIQSKQTMTLCSGSQLVVVAGNIMKSQCWAASGVKHRIALQRCYGNIVKDNSWTSKDDEPWQRKYYKYFLPIQTRWSDNDQYGHVNNVVYYSYFDSIINHYLVNHASLNTDVKTSSFVGYMVDTKCVYRSPISFPEVALAGLSVTHIGRSSVHYAVAIFPEEAKVIDQLPSSSQHVTGGLYKEESNSASHSQTACAIGHCVHVFVDAATNRPVSLLDSDLRQALEKIIIQKEVSKL